MSSPVVPRCSIRASRMLWSLTSAVARPRSFWFASKARSRRASPSHIIGSMSLPLGVVTLTDRFGGEVSPATYRRMVNEAAAALEPFERDHRIARLIRAGRMQMLGSSGTVTTLAGIHLALPRYMRALVDGSILTFEQIAAVSSSSRGSRPRRPCREPLRRPGTRRLGAERLRNPRCDLRDVAGGPPAGRRSRGARGHPVRSDPGVTWRKAASGSGRRPAPVRERRDGARHPRPNG